jgi:xanthine dehydrogenase accessory factor
MFGQFLKKTTELLAQGESFVTATVVRCQPPTSGKPGDKAIIQGNEITWGWIGGGCAQPVVVKEALKALADGRPKLVRISPSASDPEEGVVDYTMTCHSGGALDIYLEPVLPKPRILILGRSPVAQCLAQLANTVGYAVSVISSEQATEGFSDVEMIESQDFNLEGARVTPQTFVVVSTQGIGDEEALEQALKTNAAYVAFVASKTKATKVMDYLHQQGISAEKTRHVRAPAGLNIGAKSPEEIAVSILAEIIQIRASAQMRTNSAKAALQAKVVSSVSSELPVIQQEAKDPICGMMVNKSKAKHQAEYQGNVFYFCCAGCKQTFEKSPQQYLVASSV